MSKWSRMEKELELLKEKNLFRNMTIFDSAQSTQVMVEGEHGTCFLPIVIWICAMIQR